MEVSVFLADYVSLKIGFCLRFREGSASSRDSFRKPGSGLKQARLPALLAKALRVEETTQRLKVWQQSWNGKIPLPQSDHKVDHNTRSTSLRASTLEESKH
ncbi:hypothetical protein DNTS_030962, partial [Danionella cerebrum]